MEKENPNAQTVSFGHPFFVILGLIVIFYAAHLFGVKLQEVFN